MQQLPIALLDRLSTKITIAAVVFVFTLAAAIALLVDSGIRSTQFAAYNSSREVLGAQARENLASRARDLAAVLSYLQRSSGSLLQADLVLGPGEDGGYYLVGMKQLYPKLFEGIAWSTEKVLAQTMERAASLGLRTDLTPAWYDVDTPADLLRLQAELESLSMDRLQHTRRFLAGLDLSA